MIFVFGAKNDQTQTHHTEGEVQQKPAKKVH
jgi:hypothetical protein